MSLNLKDIARKLQISPATVSLVLNDKPGVSMELREKILKLVEASGSQKLRSKPAFHQNGIIHLIINKKHGLIITDGAFFGAMIESIDTACRNLGYKCQINYLYEDNKYDIFNMISQSQYDGIVLLATEMTAQDYKEFTWPQKPLILLDSYAPYQELDAVVINNVQGAYKATKHLIDMGHTRIGHLRSSATIFNIEHRRQGYENALNDHQIKIEKKYTFMLGMNAEESYFHIEKILQKKPAMPTAFFCDNDTIAIAAIRAFKEHGYKVPEDISVIGMDNLNLSEMLDPPLSTMIVHNRDMGRLAVERLDSIIKKGHHEKIKIEVSTELLARKSVTNCTF